jgi:hypothetical protein
MQLRSQVSSRGSQRRQYLWIGDLFPFDTQQANILISNATCPRACLTDFGFMTTVQVPIDVLQGGTKGFMSPELLVPKKFGFSNSILTPQADISRLEWLSPRFVDRAVGVNYPLRLPRSSPANFLSKGYGTRKYQGSWSRGTVAQPPRGPAFHQDHSDLPC